VDVETDGCGPEARGILVEVLDKLKAVWASHPAPIGKPDHCFGFAVRLATVCIDSATLRRRRADGSAARSSGEGKPGRVVQTAAPVVEETPTHWDLSRMRNCGGISGDDSEQVKYDLYTFEWETMLKNSPEDLKHRRNTGELKAMRNCGAISGEDYKRLKDDLLHFELEGMLKKGVISEGDFEILSSDLKQYTSEREVASERNCGAISAEAFTVLKDDPNKKQLECLRADSLSPAPDSHAPQHDLGLALGA